METVLAFTGFLVGTILTWLILGRKLDRKNEYIEELETSSEKQGKKQTELSKTVSELEGAGERLNKALAQRDQAISEMQERLKEFSSRSQEAVTERDRLIENLEAAQKVQDARLADLTKRIQEQGSVIKSQKIDLDQMAEAKSELDTQIRERDAQNIELREELATLDSGKEKKIIERDGQIDRLTNVLEGREADIGRLEERLREHEDSLGDLRAQLEKRDEIIQGQNHQIHEQGSYIKELKADRADLDEMYQKVVLRAEDAESRESKLGSSLEAKELKFAELHQRSRRMTDDLTEISGIGQKISSTLRNAGVKSFKKLAATDPGKIRNILEEENPSLLRLTDPTTWPEQARVASDGDWDALSKLQSSIKASKPSR